MIKKLSKIKGFTILETLVAIFILVVSITGPLSFAQTGLRASFVARDQMVASFLAQDAIEAIKNQMDQNFISQPRKDWMHGIPQDCFETVGCNLDTTKGNLTAPGDNCDSDGCPNLFYEDNSGRFLPTNNGGTPSIFSRTVYINEIGVGDEAEIVVKMKWRTNASASGFRSIVIQENVFDWYPD